MSDKHGGSAFPVPQFSHGGNKATSHDAGMTLRDYFAAHMMAGDAANSADDASFTTNIVTSRHTFTFSPIQELGLLRASAYSFGN